MPIAFVTFISVLAPKRCARRKSYDLRSVLSNSFKFLQRERADEGNILCFLQHAYHENIDDSFGFSVSVSEIACFWFRPKSTGWYWMAAADSWIPGQTSVARRADRLLPVKPVRYDSEVIIISSYDPIINTLHWHIHHLSSFILISSIIYHPNIIGTSISHHLSQYIIVDICLCQVHAFVFFTRGPHLRL